MTRNDALFHMSMLLARYSNRVANEFVSQFEHQDRVRSSDRVEMKEINEFWHRELQSVNPRVARLVLNIDVESGIDPWIAEFNKYVLHTVIERWSPDGQI